MEKVKYFEVDLSSFFDGCYTVKPIHNKFHLISTEGSFNVIAARLLNLSYAQYLRFCRDLLGAEIVGKNSMYPVAYFKDINIARRFAKLLDARANLILFERENPNWEKHQEIVEKIKNGEVRPNDFDFKNS